jgi:hypothetical protein
MGYQDLAGASKQKPFSETETGTDLFLQVPFKDIVISDKKYLVKANLKASAKPDLIQEMKNESLGSGSVALGEYVKNMKHARVLDDGTVCWIEICFCPTPLNEEIPYWEKYFENISIENAQHPKHCQDSNGEMRRACFECSCTEDLEEEMLGWGKPFI